MFHEIVNMPRNIINMETMELYKRMPTNEYNDAGYHHGELCSNCGQNEYEDVLRNIVTRKKKTKNYEKHCPSCHCPPSDWRSPPDRPRTLENIEGMINRYEHASAEPISSSIKKSQSGPLSQKIYWHDCQTNTHPRCARRSLQARRQRRIEHDKYLFRMKADTMTSELTNQDVEFRSKYTQSVPIKSSLKKHNHCREPEGSPDEQEYSDAESEISIKYTPRVCQLRKLRASNFGSRHHCVDGGGEYIAEMRNEKDIDCRQNAREYKEMKKFVLGFEDFERLKRSNNEDAVTINEDDKRIERRKLDIAKSIVEKKSSDATPYRITSKPFAQIKESIDKPSKELVLNRPTHLMKLDLNATKNHILESIDNMLDSMDDAKIDTSMQQEQIQQETIEKITRELQENGWPLLINALTIHRNSTDSNRRTVRLECLNHIRQQLDKLYTLESTLDNCSPKLQSLSSHDMSCNKEHQQSQQLPEQKTTNS